MMLCLDCGHRSIWVDRNRGCIRCGSALTERRPAHKMQPFERLVHLGFVECSTCGASPPAHGGRQWFGAGGATGEPDCLTTQAHNVDLGHNRRGE